MNGSLEVLPPEQQRIRERSRHPSGTFLPFPAEAVEQSIPQRFEHQARARSTRLAVKGMSAELSYAELSREANRVAHAILERRGPAEEPVALLLDHDVLLIAAILGTLKAGKSYVPLNAAYPPARLADMLGHSRAPLLLTDRRHAAQADELARGKCLVLDLDALPRAISAEDPALAITPDRLAYILYTSGSTGQPKGVMQNHRNVLHMIRNETNVSYICPEDRIVVLYAAGFVGAVRMIFGALLNGAALLLYDVGAAGLAALAPWLRTEEITLYNSTASVFRHFTETLAGPERFPSVRLILLGSESATRQDVARYRQHFPPSCILTAGMGATEITPFTRYFLDHAAPLAESIVPTGYACFDGVEVLVLDDNGGEVADGAPGEMVVRSRHLALGYWGEAELTRAQFRADPAGDGVRRYHTGDTGLRRADGCLVHLGRQDFQVKIRGQKVEVREVEAALLRLDTVREAVVFPQDDRQGQPRLVGYVVPHAGATVRLEALRHALARSLPAHMVPGAFVIMDALPQTVTGKVDRRALPAPDRGRPPLDVPYGAPRTPLESELARIWGEVLDRETVGIHDPFVDLGGHSLLATRVLARVIERLRVDVPVRALLEAPTVAAMALVITQHRTAQADPGVVARLLAELEARAGDDA